MVKVPKLVTWFPNLVIQGHVIMVSVSRWAYEPLIDVIRVATFGLTLKDIVLNPRLLIDL